MGKTREKIALLGNMNNINFVLLRYFRDLGFDAHLFLLSNDGRGTLEHFHPMADSVDYAKWKPFVHRLSFANDTAASLNRFIYLIYILAFIFRPSFREKVKSVFRQKRELTCIFNSFDYVIGSGIMPAMTARYGYRLDIFYPYGNGVEFLGSKAVLDMLSSKNPFKKAIAKNVKKLQAKGIQNSRNVVNTEIGVTEHVLMGLGVNPLKLFIPMIYSEKTWPKCNIENLEILSVSDRVFLYHCRHHWDLPERDVIAHSKHNDWVFNSLREVIDLEPSIQVKLLCCEYGKDVEVSKRLCKELEIEEHVIWLPKLARNDIKSLMPLVNIIIGEFYEQKHMMWGGTAWEAMAASKPLIHGFNYEDDEFQQQLKVQAPPFHKVRNSNSLTLQMLDLVRSNEQQLAAYGRENFNWFHAHNGKTAAREWIDLLVGDHETY